MAAAFSNSDGYIDRDDSADIYPRTLHWRYSDSGGEWHACTVTDDGRGNRDAYADGRRIANPVIAALLYAYADSILDAAPS